MNIQYPFVPKSTAMMQEGHIISVPLDNGRFACGRVLQFDYRSGKRNRVHFLLGLMSWSGDEPPDGDSISSSQIVEHGHVHIKTIKECNASIVCHRSLQSDGIDVPYSLDSSPGPCCYLRQGFSILSLASEEQQRNLRVFSTWGYRGLKIKAEKYFGSTAA